MVYPLNFSEFFISDEDNSFILQATLNIENSDVLPSDVEDQLIAPSTDFFRVNGSGTTRLFIEAIGFFRLITSHEDFANFLKGVAFTTNDQSPDVIRNLSVLVEEFPVGEAAPAPAFIPLIIQPGNDQPVLLSSQIALLNLTDYLPQDRANPGFNTSFLLSPDDVLDSDRRSQDSQDFIGLAITDVMVPLGLGVWQYRLTNNIDWIDLPAVLSPCDPYFATPTTRIRFSPSPSLAKSPGIATIGFRAWDGSSYTSCVSNSSVRGMVWLLLISNYIILL